MVTGKWFIRITNNQLPDYPINRTNQYSHAYPGGEKADDVNRGGPGYLEIRLIYQDSPDTVYFYVTPLTPYRF